MAKVVYPGLPNEVFDNAMQPKQMFVRTAQTLRKKSPLLLSRGEIRSALGIGEDEIVVLSIGTIGHRKGQRMLLRSMAKAAHERKLPLKLLLAGFASAAQKRDWMGEMDAHSRKVFNSRLGYTNTPYIDALFLASDLHVLNSQGENGRGETFGRATVHAMAFGLPVLGTNVGGTPEIFQDGIQGYLYPVGEAGQDILVDRIDTLVSKPDLRKRMGKDAAIHAKAHFSKDVYLSRLNEVMGKFLL